jgi:hypothetical protein
MLQNDYGMTIPLTDLLTPDLCDTLAPVLGAMTYSRKEKVEGRECHKLKLVTDDFHAQLWIDADEKAPLPRKVDISYKAEGRWPRYVGVINAWEVSTNVNPQVFVFTPPAGAQKIEMLKKDQE